jgi:hypothetical protein
MNQINPAEAFLKDRLFAFVQDVPRNPLHKNQKAIS